MLLGVEETEVKEETLPADDGTENGADEGAADDGVGAEDGADVGWLDCPTPPQSDLSRSGHISS